MKDLSAILVFVVAVSSHEVSACSVAAASVSQIVKSSELVVLARPTSITYHPATATSPGFKGDYTQIVSWKVLLSWKGAPRSGGHFITRTMVSAGPIPCATYPLVNSKAARLVLGQGRAPYSTFYPVELEYSDPYFEVISKMKTR
jgi:hypothetical protein